MNAILKLLAGLALGIAAAGCATQGPGTTAPAGNASASSTSSQSASQGPTVSRAAAAPLKAAQDAMAAQKWDEALAELAKVEALAARNPYDTHLMHEMYGYVYVNTDRHPEALTHLEAGLNTGYLSEEDVPRRLRVLAQLNYQLKNYDKALEYGQRIIERGNAEDDAYTIVAQAYYLKEDIPSLRRVVEDYIRLRTSEAKVPTEHSLRLLLDACLRLEDRPCQSRSLELLVTHHPKDDYWQNLLYSVLQADGHNERTLLNVYRLMADLDVLMRAEDYVEMAELAVDQGSPGEAQRILERGLGKGVFEDGQARRRAEQMLASARRQSESDRSALAQMERDAATARAGQAAVGAGIAFLSYEQYDKAVELLQTGLSKGSVRNEAEARLLLGIAQFEANRKDEAMATFGTVKGDPMLERIATLWTLRARGG